MVIPQPLTVILNALKPLDKLLQQLLVMKELVNHRKRWERKISLFFFNKDQVLLIHISIDSHLILFFLLGCFFFVGAAKPGVLRPHHKSVFDFDEVVNL
jgi:hypothetical protein